jgi:cytochrome c-type biogenesis protein CcmH
VPARRITVALLAALSLAAPVSAFAHPAPRASLPDIEDEVMCTVCGTPLNQAQSPQAERERAFIRKLIAQGRDKRQIKAALREQYGDQVLALPQEHGFSLAVYLVPIGLLLAALAGLAVAMPRWRRRNRSGPAAVATGPALSDADAKRLDEDLARYDP